MLVLQSSLINWRQIQITMLLYSHRLELVSKAFRYEELDGFSSPLRTEPEICQNGSRTFYLITIYSYSSLHHFGTIKWGQVPEKKQNTNICRAMKQQKLR